jgi:ankyrin repeat protein
MKKILCAVLLACSTLVWGADDSIALRLQKGLFEEEANHNLPAAIEQYKAVITATDEQRKLAATALFRLGESYHKLGREEEAKEAYSRVVRDFSDQKEVASKASERISNAAPPFVSMTIKTPETGSATNDDKLAALAALLDSSPDLLNQASTGSMPLLLGAIEKGDIEAMRFLIKRGADVNKRYRGGTPLSLAVDRGNKAAVELLIKAGVNIDARDAAGSTALHSAASHGFTVLAGLLLDKGADVNGRDNHDETPVYLAASGGYASTVELLIKRGADFERPNIQDMTPLDIAVQRGNDQVVRVLIKASANLNTINRQGDSPLLLAVKKMDKQIAELLLSAGANVNIQNSKEGTPLMWAVVHSPSPPLVPRNSSRGDDSDYQIRRGLNDSIIKVLLDHGADPDIPAKGPWRGLESPVHFAADSDSYRHMPVAILEELLKHGANPNQENSSGETPLHMATGAAQENMINTRRIDSAKTELLLRYKADPNIADKYGRTPLFYTVLGQPEDSAWAATKALLLAHANPNLKDGSGHTPLDYGNEFSGSPDLNLRTAPRIIALLKEHGATESKPEASSSNGNTGENGNPAGVLTNTTHSLPSRSLPKQEIPAQRIGLAPQ